MQNANFNELSYGELIVHVEKATEAMRRRSYEEGYTQGKLEAEIKARTSVSTLAESLHSAIKQSPPEFLSFGRLDVACNLSALTPQDIRDSTIEQAKRDVAELITRNYSDIDPMVWLDSDGGWFDITDRVEFVVNTEKRTVVALVIQIGDNRVIRRGIAKCAPSDCFSASIGKAISLRRALGLEVPSEYLTAPQPTELRVGDVVEVVLDNGEVEKREVLRVNYKENIIEMKGRMITDIHRAFVTDKYATIIDDSRQGSSQ
ncbi:MAG: hypothetical protein ACQEV7_16375 [Bacillota bacterium]